MIETKVMTTRPEPPKETEKIDLLKFIIFNFNFPSVGGDRNRPFVHMFSWQLLMAGYR